MLHYLFTETYIGTALGTIQNQYYTATGTLDAENQFMYWISYFSSDGDDMEYYLSSVSVFLICVRGSLLQASVDLPYQPSFLVKLDVPSFIAVQTLVYDPIQKKLLFFAGTLNSDNSTYCC